MPSDREYDAIEELTAVSQVNKQTRGQPRAAPPRLRSQDVSLACRGPKTRAFARRSGDVTRPHAGAPRDARNYRFGHSSPAQKAALRASGLMPGA